MLSPSPTLPKYRLAWIGEAAPQCETVLNRFSATCEQLGLQHQILRDDTVGPQHLTHQDRIVLVSSNRTDYPHQAVEFLSTQPHVTPWGVITSSWHSGSRRSGDGAITHWQQPWFRWWDSWAGWFFPQTARPGSVPANAFAPIATSADFATPHRVVTVPATQQRAAILCACPRTAEMFNLQARQAGWDAVTFRSHCEVGAASHEYALLLWDDSMVPCLPNTRWPEVLRQQLRPCDQWLGKRPLVASLDLEHLDMWPSLQELGFSELLIKSSYTLAFSNLLFYEATQRQFA